MRESTAIGGIMQKVKAGVHLKYIDNAFSQTKAIYIYGGDLFQISLTCQLTFILYKQINLIIQKNAPLHIFSLV